MKVVCISCFDYYDIRMKNIIEFFEKRGNKVRYLYADYNHYTKEYDNRKHLRGVRVHVPPYTKNMSFRRLFSHIVFSKNVRNYLNKIKPDIVYCIFPPNLLIKELAGYKKNNSGVKLAFDMYDTWPESIPINRHKFILKFPFFVWRRIRNDNLKKADLITIVSNDSKDFIKNIVGQNKIPVKVLYPVINVTLRPIFEFTRNKYFTFCYLGNVNYITDIKLIVALFKEMKSYTEIRVHFIGGGLNYGRFADELKNINVDVISHGPIFDIKEKNNIFAMCNMGLNLPKKEIHSTMALKSIEYLRAGLPFLNAGEGDNWNMIKEFQIGINVNRELLSTTARKVCALTSEDLKQMHSNCIDVYNNFFLNQDLDNIFNTIL